MKIVSSFVSPKKIILRYIHFSSPLIAAFCMLIFILGPPWYRKQALNDIASKTQSIADITAFSLSPALVFEDAETITEVLESVRQSKDLAYALVFNEGGKILGSWNMEKAEEAGYREAGRDSLSRNEQVWNIQVPIRHQGRVVGGLFLGFSLEGVNKNIGRIKRVIAFGSLILFCVGMFFTYLLSSIVTRPLRRMTEVAQQIAAGDPTKRASVTSRDEVGVLAGAFNTMVDNLGLSTRRLEEAKANLERRVEERTEELQQEIAERKKSEDAVWEINERLRKNIQELSEKKQEMAFMGEMGDAIQVSQSEKEVHTIALQFARKLFPEESGVLYVFNDARNFYESAGKWGEVLIGQDFISAEECWALRRGVPHIVMSLDSELVCPHVRAEAKGYRPYLCVPLVSLGENFGLLHMLCCQPTPGGEEKDEEDAERLKQTKQQLVLNFGQRIAMALANVRLRERLRQQSVRDPLTNLFNRRYLEETFDREIFRASRAGASVGVIMVDIDHFKQFNDAEGHEAGDMMLQAVGRFLQSCVRKEDIVCRYGGEEFTVILPGSSLEVAKKRAEILLEGVRKLDVRYGGKVLENISLSLGVAVFPDDGSTGALVTQAADSALLQAKKSGRNRVRLSREV